MKVVQFRNNNKLRCILLEILALAGPDNCDESIVEMLKKAVAMTELAGDEKAPVRGLGQLYQLGAPGALHHPGG